MRRNDANILWLSDIHYCHDDNALLVKLGGRPVRFSTIKSFFESIKNEIDGHRPTHIIITGDLSFSGQKAQFKSFYDVVLKKYLESNPDVLFLTCAGNHDIQREYIHPLLEVLKGQEIKIDVNTHSGRRFIISQFTSLKAKIGDYDEFEKVLHNDRNSTDPELLKRWYKNELSVDRLLFFNYIQFFKEYVLSRIEAINSKGDERLEITYPAKNPHYEDLLNFILVDHKYNLVFIVVNTSFYAWGKDTFDKLTNEDILEGDFNEYGLLSLDSEIMEGLDSQIRVLSKSNFLKNNVVFFLCHHPISWLHYEESLPDSRLSKIMESVDCLLCGHIHVPFYAPSIYRERTLVFDSPQLMDYKLYVKDGQALEQIGETIGFSSIKINGDLSKIIRTHHSILNSSRRQKNLNPFKFAECETFEWLSNRKGHAINKKIIRSLENVADPNKFLEQYCKELNEISTELLTITDSVYFDIGLFGDNSIDNISSVQKNILNVGSEPFLFLWDREYKKVSILYASSDMNAIASLDTFVTLVRDIMSKLSQYHMTNIINLYIFDFQLVFNSQPTYKNNINEFSSWLECRIKQKLSVILESNEALAQYYSNICLNLKLVEFFDYKGYLHKKS